MRVDPSRGGSCRRFVTVVVSECGWLEPMSVECEPRLGTTHTYGYTCVADSLSLFDPRLSFHLYLLWLRVRCRHSLSLRLSLQAAISPHRYLLWLQVYCLSLRRGQLWMSLFMSCKPNTDSLTTNPSTTGDLRKAIPHL